MKLTTIMSQVTPTFVAVKLGHDWVTGNRCEAKVKIVQYMIPSRISMESRVDKPVTNDNYTIFMQVLRQ
jgi:hypothetical protein